MAAPPIDKSEYNLNSNYFILIIMGKKGFESFVKSLDTKPETKKPTEIVHQKQPLLGDADLVKLTAE